MVRGVESIIHFHHIVLKFAYISECCWVKLKTSENFALLEPGSPKTFRNFFYHATIVKNATNTEHLYNAHVSLCNHFTNFQEL